MKLYLDGLLVASTNYTGSFSNVPGGGIVNRIGTDARDESGLIGQIDEVRVWSMALSPEQIQAGMTSTLTGHEAGLTGLWTFDDPARPGMDLTTNGHHGRLIGQAHTEAVVLPRSGGA